MKYSCKGTVIIEEEIEAEDAETAEMLMLDRLFDEYASLDWIIEVEKK